MRSLFIVLGSWLLWLVGISFAQAYFLTPVDTLVYNLGYLPVTCHLTCPVNDYISKSMGVKSPFHPQRFSSWPELKEAFLSGHTPAAFVLAPMAIALREQGVPLRIIYLGHRDGTAMMVRKDDVISHIEDLRGRTVAVPNRFSNQFLLLFKTLRDHGMGLSDIHMVELAPPDMPVALQTGAVDAVTSGEPFMAQTEMDGFGRPLYLTKDVWPGFISCVLVVLDTLRESDPVAVQTLVHGIARSGLWLDSNSDHRMDAAEFVGKNYYNQNPALLQYVLSKPPDRVRYTDLALRRADFEQIEELGKAAGILKGTMHFDDYTDTQFSNAEVSPIPWEQP